MPALPVLGGFTLFALILYGVIEWINHASIPRVDFEHVLKDLKTAEVDARKRLVQQEFIAAMLQNSITAENIATLINDTLMMTGLFMNVSKIALAQLNTKINMLEFDYEWYNEKHKIPKLPKRAYSFTPGSLTYNTFITRGDVYVACNDVAAAPELAPFFQNLGIKAFVEVPIYISNTFWGILCVDECVTTHTWDESDIQLIRLIANTLAGLIIRGVTEEHSLRMSAMNNRSPQFVIYCTAAGEIKYVNQGACTISGYSAEEIMHYGLNSFFDDELVRLMHEKYLPYVLTHRTHHIELPLKRKDGVIRTLAFSVFTLDTKEAGVGAIASDVTEIRQLEKELIAAKEKAEQSSNAKGSFLSRMSHEMRTPMNAIIGMTTIARASLNPVKMEYCLAKINEASIHLLGIINDILDMSKIEAGKFELSMLEFNFEKMLLRVTNVMNFRVDEKRHNFIVRLDRNMPGTIIADEQRLAQVLTNLLTNAIKFTPEEGTITLGIKQIASTEDLSTLQFTVSDSGIGITPEQQCRLFSSFEQADISIARKYGGTGLGLAISKSIVELMGGSIWVTSKPGNGSTFTFEVTVAQGKNKLEDIHNPKVDWEKLRILAVDDSPEVLEYMQEFAVSMGINYTAAPDGIKAYDLMKEAAQNMQQVPFDLVFVDWRMPQMNGIELTKKIKEQFGQHVVVIMISATEWNIIEAEAKAAGVDGFVPKPLFPSALVDCINTHLSSLKPDTAEMAPPRHFISDMFSDFHILLAEDVEINREIVLSLLEDTGVSIHCAENGIEALRMFEADPRKYDIILMDIHMPEMDGFEATRRIRALDVEAAKTVPIMAMTANVFREDIEKCLAAGMSDHVGKPIDIDEVMQKLKSYLLGPS
ncbi:MAG: response regulator [Treponema sp.]|nr:response regulator [Treponema sp.]